MAKFKIISRLNHESITRVNSYLSGESGLNKKIVTVALIVLMAVAFAIVPTKLTFGQSQLGVQILQIVPQGTTVVNGSSTLTGPVGIALNLQGTCYTSYGPYQILFNGQVVVSATSVGYYVNANFSVPALPAGTYAVRIRDINANVNSTEDDFQVTTSYLINAVPTQVQEGSGTTVAVSVTGGSPSTSYSANVSVVLPSPLNTQYSQIASLSTTDQTGGASAQVTFPSTSLQPSGSATDYAGSYTAYFNQSALLAQTEFSVGFLDSTTYHRNQTVTINATGYTQDQVATLSIINTATGTSIGSQSLTASDAGVISGTWPVPSNIAIGLYSATITPQSTQKTIQDSENFSISGYPIQVQTVNLAGEAVSQITIQALDTVTNAVYSNTSDSNGVATLNLENGGVSLQAFWNGVNVGQDNVTISGAGTFTIACQLTDLQIIVQNGNGVPVPFVNLDVTFNYQNGTSQTGNYSGQTNSSGLFTLNSTLIGVKYSIAASLYNQVFNSGNNTVSSLPAQGISQVLIICPTEALTLSVVGSDKSAIPDARIELVELSSGLFYTATTNSSGLASSQVTFGIYRMQIYDKDNILINETNIQAFSNSQQQIVCTLYGIKVSVSVVDFFGDPIANANVTLNGPCY